MSIYQWTDSDGNGDFGDGENWINATSSPPMPGEPGASDTAIIDGSGSISGSGNVAELVFAGDGGTLFGNDLQITAQVVVLGGAVALTNDAEFYVTYEVEEASSSTVTLNGGSELYINGDDSPSGTASVIGLDVNVSAGGSASVLNLTGFGTEIYVEAENAVIGDEAAATMTISAGAELDTSDYDDTGAGQVILGNQQSVGGTMTITGSYSSLLAGGTVLVGNYGNGQLTVEAGAEVQLDPAQNQGDALEIGYENGSTGLVTVTGAGSRLIAYTDSQSTIGHAGAGALMVANHGFVELGSVTVGAYENSGAIAVENAGSMLEVRGALEIGLDGTADLGVTSGGQVVVDGNQIVALGVASGSGTINVSGKGSSLNCGNSPFAVGYYGTGRLTISAAGSLNSSGSDAYGAAAATLGFGSGSAGSASVTGAGSLWTTSGELEVGDAGTGTLSIGSDGEVGAGTLATSVSAAASISLSGTGSELVVTGNAQLGGTALTNLSIGTGSKLTSGGTITLTDAKVALSGGTLAAGSTIVVGQSQAISGYGTITATTIDNNATITSSGGTLVFVGGVNAEGNLEIGGGSTMAFDGYVIAGQTLQFQTATGTLQLGMPTEFGAVIADFAKGDVIDLVGIAAKSLSFSDHTLTVTETNGSSLGLTFGGTYSTGSFAAPHSDGHGGTLITHS
jgi:T5SS/PEP-CTERM-associated repeat protein